MVDGLEKERDFYFHKLRDVELLLQQSDQNDETAGMTGAELSDMIFKILYATDEDEAGEDAAAPAPADDSSKVSKPETNLVAGAPATGESEEMLF